MRRGKRMDKQIAGSVFVNNVPDYAKSRYMVVKMFEGRLWFYGSYEDERTAEMASCEVENGIVIDRGNGK